MSGCSCRDFSPIRTLLRDILPPLKFTLDGLDIHPYQESHENVCVDSNLALVRPHGQAFVGQYYRGDIDNGRTRRISDNLKSIGFVTGAGSFEISKCLQAE